MIPEMSEFLAHPYTVTGMDIIFLTAIIFVVSSLLTAVNLRDDCCKFKNCTCIPYIRYLGKFKIPQKVGFLFQKLIQEQYTRTIQSGHVEWTLRTEGQENGEVIVDLDDPRVAQLSESDLLILKGLIMTNGMNYYEVSQKADQKLQSFLENI
jgi:hypothetical protein